MKVFNLTEKMIDYRGKTLPPGGSQEFPELDVFVPTRDRELERQHVLAFGELPSWWKLERDLSQPATSPPSVPTSPPAESLLKPKKSALRRHDG
jgi:hypothetical protein